MSRLYKIIGIIIVALVIWYFVIPLLWGTIKTIFTILLLVVIVGGLIYYFGLDKLKACFQSYKGNGAIPFRPE